MCTTIIFVPRKKSHILPCNRDRTVGRFRLCFQMVMLSFSEVIDVAHRIIILEILRIRSLMAKAIVRRHITGFLVG